ncbi:MAG: NAD-dependent protein deacetylase [Gammaproteobacteria bacterium]|nr:NAD-dependent protein deacetylase [Gammaproteobacteria bacterium]
MNNETDLTSDLARLEDFLARHHRLFVLTGAGISTGSGIPDYRDANGDWKHHQPIQYRDFLNCHATRQRYWARSLIGWPWFGHAEPNVCHVALAAWERAGRIAHLVTQNVDRLHQRAGSRSVTDLHGRLDQVVCLDCSHQVSRWHVQDWLLQHNPSLAGRAAQPAPDGDAEFDEASCLAVAVPACPRCGGILKPNVVFYGESIPRQRVDATIAALHDADALLVIGSSLMVYSGFRFCRLAAEADIPLAAINSGRTRADDLLEFKIQARFEDVLEQLSPGGVSLA